MSLKSLRFRFIGLFVVALIFVFILWDQIGHLAEENKNQFLKNETFVFVQSLLPNYTMGNLKAIQNSLNEFGYTICESLPRDMRILYEKNDEFLSIAIFESQNKVGFSLHYFDDFLIATRPVSYDFWDKHKIYILLLPIILILFIFQATLFSLLNPLNHITRAISEFAKGNYKFELKSNREDELGILVRSFAHSSHTITKMLKSRELILRSLGHEIRTPIAKLKLALQQNPLETKKLTKYVNDLQKISENILEFERVNSGNITIYQKDFFTETLILESLSGFESEASHIYVEIKDNDLLHSDLRLLSIALKNLIDNALKYSEDGKVRILAQNHTLNVINKAKPLAYDLSYYLEPFYRDEAHQSIKGYGLGLSIIVEILKTLHFELSHRHDGTYHHFCIHLKSAN